MTAGQGKRAWDLTPDAFQGLLAFLDPDPRQAGEKYEKIREKLTRFFEWRGCVPGDEFTDKTFDRVARKLQDGLESAPAEPYLYFHGVALNVARERWRAAEREPRLVGGGASIPVINPIEVPQISESEHERRLGCLQDCIDRLTPMSRDLLTSYHLGGTGINIGRRKGLAERLNIPAAALRLRVYRVRRTLQTCVDRCLGSNETFETFLGGGH